MSEPALTVVMPAHNTEAFIGPAIRSILNQDFEDLELWVLENGSSDKTAEVAGGFNDPRLRVFRLGAVGFQGALEFALRNAKTKWLARMDSDDLCLANRISAQMDALQTQREISLVGTSYAFITPFGHVIERSHGQKSRILTKEAIAMGGCRPEFPNARFCADPSMIFCRELALKVGGYDPQFIMGDVPLWLRMLEISRGWELAQSLYLYRLLPTSFSTTHSEGEAVRAKYAKEQLGAYVSIFGQRASVDARSAKGKDYASYWRKLGFLELLAAEPFAVAFCVKVLLALGDRSGAKHLRWRCLVARIWPSLFAQRYAKTYRRRFDIEKQLSALDGAENDLRFLRPREDLQYTWQIVRNWGLLPKSY